MHSFVETLENRDKQNKYKIQNLVITIVNISEHIVLVVIPDL